MNNLELQLQKLNDGLYNKFRETSDEVELMLNKYVVNFPTFTDHSIKHSKEVLKLASELLTTQEIANLNGDEIYVLAMACILHDIGMCIPKTEIEQIHKLHQEAYSSKNSSTVDEELIRDIHHELSYSFIKREFLLLKIPNERYANAIGLVAMGHRRVALDDHDLFPSKVFVKDGRNFICLPYLASILRLADELDITNRRTPKLLTKYYMPENERSVKEWNKHIATTQINFTEDKVIYEVTCSDHNGLAALEEQFDKVGEVIKYCQKIVRTISNTEIRKFALTLNNLEAKYTYKDFDPKGIKFSFDVQNVIKTFIGEDLYNTDLVAVREAVQNSIDSCRYKKGILGEKFKPEITVTILEDALNITDNGLGMDEFIIENFFGKLGGSFYEQEKVKKEFEAIGQFGIGVFSYFLLGEYLDIETKKENNKSLKFRIDNDPNSYFHFFDQSERCETGTSITIFFKRSKIGKYKYSDFVNYIHHTFRHIEFPILIKNHNEQIFIEKRSKLDIETELKSRLKVIYKNKYKNFKIISHSIENDDFEGECALIINDFPKNKPLSNIEKYFDYDCFETEDSSGSFSQISISQKGVFVNNYSSDYLSFIFGQINFKKNRRIKLNRQAFSDNRSVLDVVDIFNAALIKELFIEIKPKYSIPELVRLSNDFLSNYVLSYFWRIGSNSNFGDSLLDNIYLEVFDKNGSKNQSIREIIEIYDSFVIITNLENKKVIHKVTNLPLIIVNQDINTGCYYSIFGIFTSLFKLNPSLTIYENKVYQKISNHPQKYLDYLSAFHNLDLYDISDCQEFDNNLIGVNLFQNKREYMQLRRLRYHSTIFNINHAYIKYLFENLNYLANQKEYLRIIKNSIDMIESLIYKRPTKKGINDLNLLIKQLPGIEDLVTFAKEDFAINSKTIKTNT